MAKEHLAETLQRLHEIVEPVLDADGLELVELQLQRGPRRYLLRVLIDRKGRVDYRPPPADKTEDAAALDGVTIDDCARTSKALSPLLDVEDVIAGAYTLEVSSPGVNRPLRKPAHFARAVGEKVRVKTRVPIGGTNLHVAPLLSADDDRIVIEVGDEHIEVPYRLISKANLDFDFKF